MSKRRKLAVAGTIAMSVAVLVAAVTSWLRQRGEVRRRTPTVVPIAQENRQAISGRRSSAEATAELGRTFEELVNSGDQDALVDLVDWNILLGRAFGDAGFTPEQGAALVSTVRDISRGEGGFAAGFIRLVESGATFSFRKVINIDGRPVALCRMLPHNAGPVFYELVGTDRDGQTRIGDIYFYATGEMYSQMARRLITPALAEQSPGREGRVPDLNSEFFKSIAVFREISKAMRESRWADALAAYDRLPESLQHDKAFHLLAIAAAGQADERRYVELVESFEKAHPDDPALLATKIGYHYVRGELPEMVRAIKRLDEYVGGDAALKAQWAWAELKAGNVAEAERVISAALEEEPDLVRAHGMAVAVAAAAGNEALAMERIRDLDQRFGATPDGLRSILSEFEAAKPFLESAAFREWEAGQESTASQ